MTWCDSSGTAGGKTAADWLKWENGNWQEVSKDALLTFEGVNLHYCHAKSEMFHPAGGTRDSHLSRAMQHRCRMDAVVSSTSSEVRTRQKVSP